MISLLCQSFPPAQEAHWEDRPDLGQVWLGSLGDSRWLFQSVRWPRAMVAESVGLGSCPKVSVPTQNFSPPLHLPYPLPLTLIPSYFPKILTKHFCTIKFNHNYKNVALGLCY